MINMSIKSKVCNVASIIDFIDFTDLKDKTI